MKRLALLLFLLVALLTSSGCFLGMAALIRWDQRRAKRMAEEAAKDEGATGTTAEEADVPFGEGDEDE